jgi:phosphopantetheinyl transferase
MDFNKTIRDSLYHQVYTIGSSETIQEPGYDQSIQHNSMHIWFARYQNLDPFYTTLSHFITTNEWKRARGFKQPSDARKYILRHGILRFIMGECTGREPGQLTITEGKNGKPSCNPLQTSSDITFSLSGTREMLCMGVTRQQNIGIDLVKPDPQYPFREVMDTLFSPKEREIVEKNGFPHIMFYRIWALKEALLKAVGGTVQMMSDTDVSGVINDSVVHDYYSLSCHDMPYCFFIQECGFSHEHHCAVVVNFGIKKNSWT